MKESNPYDRRLVHASCVALSFLCVAVNLLIATGHEMGGRHIYETIGALALTAIALGHLALFLARRKWAPVESGRTLTLVSIGFGYITLAVVLYIVCSDYFAKLH